MKHLLLALLIACFTVTNAQKEVRLDELKEYIGDSVKVHGKISGVAYSSNSKQKSMLIYLEKSILSKHLPLLFLRMF